jgi:hypothetical protein
VTRAAQEAVYAPLVFLTVALLGGVRIADRVILLPPPLFTLVLALLMLAALVKCGALVPARLVHASRSALANLNGFALALATFAASAQAFNMATPDSGLPRVLFYVLFLVLLLNTLAASTDRVRLLRSLLVIFGSAFTLKFVVLAAVSSPAEGPFQRALQALFEGVTLGMVSQGALHPATGYVAFFTLTLFMFGLMLLPSSEAVPDRRRLPEP